MHAPPYNSEGAVMFGSMGGWHSCGDHRLTCAQHSRGGNLLECLRHLCRRDGLLVTARRNQSPPPLLFRLWPSATAS